MFLGNRQCLPMVAKLRLNLREQVLTFLIPDINPSQDACGHTFNRLPQSRDDATLF